MCIASHWNRCAGIDLHRFRAEGSRVADRWQNVLTTGTEELDTPLVVVHRDVLKRNIEDMAAFAKEHGVQMRPHVKTHKTLEIAQMQLRAGAVGLTCAKLGEAEVFLENGFHSVLIAYPLVGSKKIGRLFDLMKRFPEADIQTLVDDVDHATILSQKAVEQGVVLPLWVKIDSGLRRVGVLPGAPAVEVVRQVVALAGVKFRGLLTHAGHAYGAATPAQVQVIGRAEAECLLETASALRTQGIDVPEISVGSTPTVRVSGAVAGVTEIRPGNYVFNDATQVHLGSATEERCALRVGKRSNKPLLYINEFGVREQ